MKDSDKSYHSSSWKTIKSSWGGFILIFLLWTLLAFYQQTVEEKPFPYPWEAAGAIITGSYGQTGILPHAGASFLRWITAFSISALIGIMTGILMGLFAVLDRLLLPVITMIQLIPGLAWVPITLILFGLGNKATIFMIAVTALAPVVINTRTGIIGIDSGYFRVAAMLELKPETRFFRIILPGAAPSVISGLRIGAANGFRVLISAEMVVGSGLGLGYSLYQSRWTLDYNSAFGILIIIALIGLLIDKIVFSFIENRIRRKRGLQNA